ncbi:MAG: hypothetical protein GY807_21690, partial [Gammaproteobacteria bacterium]|nr:hypothetical protein [Gammaproteobacteria bacterium]
MPRSEVVVLTLTDSEVEALDNIVHNMGITRSEYCRRAILQPRQIQIEPMPINSKVQAHRERQLSMIQEFFWAEWEWWLEHGFLTAIAILFGRIGKKKKKA